MDVLIKVAKANFLLKRSETVAGRLPVVICRQSGPMKKGHFLRVFFIANPLNVGG